MDERVAAAPRVLAEQGRGNYFPPAGGAGEAMDRVLMNRIAKASTRDFLDRLAAEIIARAPAMPAPGSEA